MSKGDYKICVYKSCNSCSQKIDCTKYSEVFFVPFPNPMRETDKYKRWLQICQSKQLYISRYTTICSLHFVGGRGPTKEHPDPIPERPMKSKKVDRKEHKQFKHTEVISKNLVLF